MYTRDRNRFRANITIILENNHVMQAHLIDLGREFEYRLGVDKCDQVTGWNDKI